MASTTGIERPYTEADLAGLKKDDLIALVKGQLDRWPIRPSTGRGRKKGFNPSKDTVAIMRTALLNPNGTFTTTAALPNRDTPSIHSPVQPPIHSHFPTILPPGLPTLPPYPAVPVPDGEGVQTQSMTAGKQSVNELTRYPTQFVSPPSLRVLNMPAAMPTGHTEKVASTSNEAATQMTDFVFPPSHPNMDFVFPPSHPNMPAASTTEITGNTDKITSTSNKAAAASEASLRMSGEGNTSESQLKSLTVFLEDNRLSTHRRTAHDVDVRFEGSMGCSHGQWRASTKDIIDGLDGTGAIKGFIKLSCPHHRNPQFMNEFMIRRPGTSRETEINIDSLVISAASELYVHIEDAIDLKRVTAALKQTHDVAHGVRNIDPILSSVPPTAQPSPVIQDDNQTNTQDEQNSASSAEKRLRDQGHSESKDDTDLKPLERARKRAKHHSSRSERTTQSDSETIEWLKAKLLEREGHDFYSHSHNRTRHMQNSDIVRYWDFGAAFVKEYNKKKCPITNKKITKTLIDSALGCGETWRNEAEKATEWIHAYGQSAEVREELEMKRDSPLGIGVLYKFLKDWHASHKT